MNYRLLAFQTSALPLSYLPMRNYLSSCQTKMIASYAAISNSITGKNCFTVILIKTLIKPLPSVKASHPLYSPVYSPEGDDLRFFIVFFPPKPLLCNRFVEVRGIEPLSISSVNMNQRILIVPTEGFEPPMSLTSWFYRPLASASLHMSALCELPSLVPLLLLFLILLKYLIYSDIDCYYSSSSY